jgi:metallo-beta-lactamase family protein
MLIRFCGAASEVTGSCHYLEAGGLRFIMDCGLFQGGGDQFERNTAPFPFDPKSLDLMLLSHAHIDHIGRLPLLVRRGFEKRILATTPTVDLCQILLRDSAHIQEEDAAWKVKRLRKRGEDASWVKPLYTQADAEKALSLLEGVDYDTDVPLNENVTARWSDAGHILGSAHLELSIKEKGVVRKLVFSGDVGNRGTPILRDPTPIAEADVVLVESTYGNRLHEHLQQRAELFRQILTQTLDRGGKVIIPSFAVGRTQEILYELNPLAERGLLDGTPVYVDSPMAVNATEVFEKHPEDYDADAAALMRSGDNPMEFPGLHLIRDVEESKALNNSNQPCIIISANGMCTAGRIKHHLKHNVGNKRNTILFVGFQAQGSLGRLIKDGAKQVRIFGEMHTVRAQVAAIDGFSAHADRDGLLWWLNGFRRPPQRVFMVHGEDDVAHSFAQLVVEQKGWQTSVPKLGEEVNLNFS